MGVLYAIRYAQSASGNFSFHPLPILVPFCAGVDGQNWSLVTVNSGEAVREGNFGGGVAESSSPVMNQGRSSVARRGVLTQG